MRVITVPEAVTIPPADGVSVGADDRTITMKEFLMIAVNQHAGFGKGIGGVRQGLKIADAVSASNGTIRLEDADHAELSGAVEAAAYNPAVARFLLPFYEAVHAAATETAKATVP